MFRSLLSLDEYDVLEGVLSSSMGKTAASREDFITSLLGNLPNDQRESLVGSIVCEGERSVVARNALSQLDEAFRQRENAPYVTDFLQRLAAEQTGSAKKSTVIQWQKRVDFLAALGDVSDIVILIKAARNALSSPLDDTIQQGIVERNDWGKRIFMARYLCTHQKSRLAHFVAHVMDDPAVKANPDLCGRLKETASAAALGECTDEDWAEGARRVQDDTNAPAAIAPPVVAVIIDIDSEKVGPGISDDFPKQNLPHKIELRYCEPNAKAYTTPGDTPPWHICHIPNFTETGRAALYNWLKGALPKALNRASDAGNPIAAKTRIDFYLPFHLLNEPVQSWETKKLMTLLPIGKQRRVAVRSLDRQREAQCLADMRARFTSFALKMARASTK